MLFNKIKENLKLSSPILATRLLGIVGNLIAMLFIARLGTDALSASALIMGIFSVCVLLVMAFGFSVCALVAAERGRQSQQLIGELVRSALVLNTFLAVPFLLLFYYIPDILVRLHQPHAVAVLTGDYFHGLLFGYLPMIWASVLEQYFIGIGKPKYIVYLSVLGVVIMPVFSGALIFGWFGLPMLGMLGAGVAVALSAWVSLIFLLLWIALKKWHLEQGLFIFNRKPDGQLMKKLFHLGWPMALQFGGEFLAYTLITIMMGWVGVVALAAQQVLLQFTSVVIMVPTSVSQATAVLVGQAYGQKNMRDVRTQVAAAIWVVTGFMLLIGLVYLCFPARLAQLYVDVQNPVNASILSLTKILFAITAVSQCFDGVRNVLAGAYRGLQDTKTAMRISFFSVWLITMPLAYLLGFTLHGGAVGIRWGFALGIILATCLLLRAFYKTLACYGRDDLLAGKVKQTSC